MYRISVKRKIELMKRLKNIASGDFKDFFQIAGDETVKDIIGNIRNQIEPSGKPLKRNAPETQKIKMRLLGHSLSLIWYKVLSDPGTWIIQAAPKRARIFLKAIRQKIGVYLEHKGYHFLGFSKKVRGVIFAKWREFIAKGLR